ncbi:MAG: copper resistance protein CopC [Candidatus Rokubacteria bacterium]|nr:copper resistance protein CopC [Candidatus Rokubacteria bacterium]MBI3108166.1 copper resistance protein CopC [Candidatus Rokubacteria bacterium]
MRHRGLRGVPSLCLLLSLSWVVVAFAQPAWRHGILLESSPKDGETVSGVTRLDLRFNSRIDPAFSRLRLSSGPPRHLSAAAPLALEAPAPDRVSATVGPLSPGPYTVHWQVFAKDGHLSHGRSSFELAREPK